MSRPLILLLFALSACTSKPSAREPHEHGHIQLRVQLEGADIARLHMRDHDIAKVEVLTQDASQRDAFQETLDRLISKAKDTGLGFTYHKREGKTRMLLGATGTPGKPNYCIGLYEHLERTRYNVRIVRLAQ